jgi:predicted DNA-binding transcriptional regulator AlpA
MPAVDISSRHLIDESAVAEMTGFEVQTVRNWRSNKKVALPFLKIGRSVRYRLSDVEAFLEKCRVIPVDINPD